MLRENYNPTSVFSATDMLVHYHKVLISSNFHGVYTILCPKCLLLYNSIRIDRVMAISAPTDIPLSLAVINDRSPVTAYCQEMPCD